MIKKIAIAACLASALMMMSVSANAAAYFIGGKWYYFSLDFEADIAKITGRDIKIGTYIGANVKILDSNVQCANPQGALVEPGKGPQLALYGTSEAITDDNLNRKIDRTKGTSYTTTAVVALPKEPVVSPCKDPNGQSAWQPVYWQKKVYGDLAVKVNDSKLRYVTGSSAGTEFPNTDDWVFVYLPTVFKFKGTLANSETVDGYDFVYGACTFPENIEPGANYYGEAYSLRNPPVAGWAAAKVGYFCGAIQPGDY